jgi:enoyl-CoA hydratase/carnithine racemase
VITAPKDTFTITARKERDMKRGTLAPRQKTERRTKVGRDMVITQIHDDGVAEFGMNMPESLNALSPKLIDELTNTVCRLDRDNAARVLLLTGIGQHFCAGADINAILEMPVSEAVRTAFTGCCQELAKVTKPVIVAVNGCALGGGCELVEMCDIVVAADNAVFGHPEVTLGTMPGAGGTQRLPRALGKHKALDLLMTGRNMDVTEAERAGLVSRIVPASDLLQEARGVAGKLAAYSQPVLTMIKASVALTDEMPLESGLAPERGLFHRSLTLADSREGMNAFKAKRDPVFKDR